MTEDAQENSGDADDNVVYVGSKPAMSYVLAVVTQFSEGHPEVHVKARGRAISRAVDVAEIVRNRFVEEADIKDIQISTDEVTSRDGNDMNVSSIHITLTK